MEVFCHWHPPLVQVKMTHWEEKVRGETTPVTVSSWLSSTWHLQGLHSPCHSSAEGQHPGMTWCNLGYEIPASTRVCCQQKPREALSADIWPKDEGGTEQTPLISATESEIKAESWGVRGERNPDLIPSQCKRILKEFSKSRNCHQGVRLAMVCDWPDKG